MQRFAIALTLWIAAWTVAVAQSNTRWTDPGGHFSLDYAPLGWTPLTPPPDAAPDLLEIEHHQFQQGGLMRTCIVTQRSSAVPPQVDQRALNAYAASRTPQDLAQRGVVPSEVDHVSVDGIVVIDATFDQPMHEHMRVFYLRTDSAMLQFVINCGATNPVSSDVTSNIDAVLQTLHINH